MLAFKDYRGRTASPAQRPELLITADGFGAGRVVISTDAGSDMGMHIHIV